MPGYCIEMDCWHCCLERDCPAGASYPYCSDLQMSAGFLSYHARLLHQDGTAGFAGLMNMPIRGFLAHTAVIFRCQLGF